MRADLEFHEIHTEVIVIVPALGASDLTDHFTRRIVIPERVELRAVRIVKPTESREWVSVSVHGPRRLKSGLPGKEISSFGWDSAVVESYDGAPTSRPDWLTALITKHLPEGWSSVLVDVTATGGATDAR
ncbi:hypothetical protein [Streptomyces niveus]|uniref:hypothetical protein n=1 Tax=Streptomyces niveus TaxID=193462 RepID=UPI00084BF251|nr:hypothetical protein [Streptomyces niveus]